MSVNVGVNAVYQGFSCIEKILVAAKMILCPANDLFVNLT